MAIVSSSNGSYEQGNSVSWLNKYGFHKKSKNKYENEDVKKHHRNNVKKSSVEDIISFFTRNDNNQDVAYEAFNHTIDENSYFTVPSWIRSINREDMHKKYELENQDESCSRS